MGTLKRYWPSIAHVLGIAVIAYSPDVQKWLLGHPAYSLVGGAIWGWALHWAQSPSQKPPTA